MVTLTSSPVSPSLSLKNSKFPLCASIHAVKMQCQIPYHSIAMFHLIIVFFEIWFKLLDLGHSCFIVFCLIKLWTSLLHRSDMSICRLCQRGLMTLGRYGSLHLEALQLSAYCLVLQAM